MQGFTLFMHAGHSQEQLDDYSALDQPPKKKIKIEQGTQCLVSSEYLVGILVTNMNS